MEQNKKSPVHMTQDDVERIMNLPERTIYYAGLRKQAKVDEENQYYYPLTDEGTLEGKRIRCERSIPVEETSSENSDVQEPKEAEREPDTQPDTQGEQHKPDRRSRRQEKLKQMIGVCKRGSKKKLQLPESPAQKKALLFAALFLVLFVVFVQGMNSFQKNIADLSAGTQSEENKEGKAAEEADDLSAISVVQVTHDLIPGDQLTTEDIQECKISAADYNLFSLSDVSIYKWNTHESLLGTYVTAYIPAGRYLTYANVNAAYVMEKNPWVLDPEEWVPFLIPIQEEEQPGYGAVLNLHIERKSLKQTEQSSQETSVSELQHTTTIEQSYVIDTYDVKSVVVQDMLNDTRTSLYPIYAAWVQIPTGEQAQYIKSQLQSNKELRKTMTPAYLQVGISKEAAKELGTFRENEITISWEITGRDNTTKEKEQFAAQAEALELTLKNVLEGGSTSEE